MSRQSLGDKLLLIPPLHAKITNFAKQEIIFSQGDRSRWIFFLDKGLVKLTRASNSGKEATIALLPPGAFFGENALASDQPLRSDRATALTAGRTIRVEPNALLRLLHTDAEACDLFIVSLIKLKTATQDDLAGSILFSAERRLARALLGLAALRGEQRSLTAPKFSQQDFANMIGVSRQRVNALMQSLRKSGFIHNRGELGATRSSIAKISRIA
jgi:CRP/FNR family transcriptional regulator